MTSKRQDPSHEDATLEALDHAPQSPANVRVGRASQSSEHDANADLDKLDSILESCLEKYARVAPLSDRSQLEAFLPSADQQTIQFVLIELIKLDMAMAAESGTIRKIESYIAALPGYLSLESTPVDLVMEEVQLRREAGETLDHQDYRTRFPQFDTVVGQMLGAAAEVTSAVKKRSASPELEIGQQIDDFLIIQTLGSGAFAQVYLARQVSMHRLVALKVSRGTGDEPRALSQFDHPNIVRVYDQRELDAPPVHLLYMQFQPGGTLSDVVKLVNAHEPRDRNGQILLDAVDRQLLRSAQAVPERSSVRRFLKDAEWSTVVAWLGIQLARALDDAHSRGVLHRDVKPANVLLSSEGIPKLADFNVSFAGAAGRAGAASNFGGSIGYMAPEHLRAINARILDEPETVGEKADLYALGILLWELWQGRRPHPVDTKPVSWTQVVAQQLDARVQPPSSPVRIGTASERVLESTLRYALAFNADERPSSGAELAGRLKLALYPDAAKLFDPDPSSWRSRVLNWSPWWVPCLVLLVPNVFVMAFNFLYNDAALLSKHDIPGLKEYFQSLALIVSTICLGIGVYFVIRLTKQFAASIRLAQANQPIGDASIASITRLGQNAALIGGFLWAVAGLIYPIALSVRFPQLPTGECVRFFFSLVICGGVAAVYPYFGMATLGTLLYYPRLIRNSMQDSRFDQRAARVIQQAERFWLAAVTIPLLGAGLLVFSDSQEKSVVLTAVAATGIGAFLALNAYTIIQTHWSNKMSGVLSEKDASVTPGLGTDNQH